MLIVCPICNTNLINFGSKVEVTKMRTKPVYALWKTRFLVYSLESNVSFWSGSQFYVECDQPRGWKVADHPPKGPQTQSAPEGGRKDMTMMIMTMTMMMMIMMMNLMMTLVIVMCFLHLKGPLTGLVKLWWWIW